MANLRDIRRRIRSIKNTAQITKAMQLVAASKMKRAQEQATAGRAYAQLLAELLQALRDQSEVELQHPYLETREIKRRGLLILGTDKGLCGALNVNLFRQIADQEGDFVYVAVGRKATQWVSRSGRDLDASFMIDDQARYTALRPAIDLLLEKFRSGEVDTVEIAFPRFINTLKQEPTIAPLIPLRGLDEMLEHMTARHDFTAEAPIAEDQREMKIEPSAEAILDELLNLFVRREAYQMLLEAKASEHSARMVAMKSATDNAKSLVDDLTLDYNKARQAAITQEILELSAAGAEG
jgi:F-type H+-transporting ATPase subunit gamma